MKTVFKTAVLFLFLVFAANAISQPIEKLLWPDGVPNSQKSDDKEIMEQKDAQYYRLVQNPDIKVYLPVKRNATNQAVVVCPGGGYWVLAYDWEGTDIAKYLNSIGVAAVVLKYRLPVSKSNVVRYKSPLMDAQRAIKMTRYYAKEWNIDSTKVGIMGFSAGGHLASTVCTHIDSGNAKAKDPIDRLSARPDFAILMYPVISFTKFMHKGSRDALLGEDASHELIEQFSNELQVSKDTPPTLLIHATDDGAVPVENSLFYYQALRKYNIPAAMYIFPTGGHGFGLGLGRGNCNKWTELCRDWLSQLNN